ncbi:MAG: hypothetical protein AAF798_10235 [Bacteroidota bacterium]
MFPFPKLRRLRQAQDLECYASTYTEYSGLGVPMAYLQKSENRVYGIYRKGELIGGFILATGSCMRTLEVFAQADARKELYDMIGAATNFTEITCFWIAADYRKNQLLNTYVWLALAISLRRFSKPGILFGTCSTSLARLYGVTPKSKLIHRDRINNKPTYIFRSERSSSLRGFFQILQFKWSRMRKIKEQRKAKALV